MTKLLLILVSILLVVGLAFAWFIRVIRSVFRLPTEQSRSKKQNNEKDEVVFRNNEVVILKGEAGQKNKED